LFNFFPTDAKFRSLSSANNGSVEDVKWYFFLSSFRRDTTGADDGGDPTGPVDPEAVDGFGGEIRETGSST